MRSKSYVNVTQTPTLSVITHNAYGYINPANLAKNPYASTKTNATTITTIIFLTKQ